MTVELAIIPEPVSMTTQSGHYALSEATGLYADEGAEKALAFAADLFNLQTTAEASAGMRLRLDAEATPDEGYRLTVTSNAIEILASDERGLFHGVQTLRQLLPAEQVDGRTGTVEVPNATIEDYPRFSWRAMHLDVGRHMFPVEFIKKFIDLLAFHKMNIFHWHLTEDQGWRIEIEKYPRLTEIGSIRAETPIPADRQNKDGTPYGGYYTKAEVREVVAYADSLGIQVVPEIELPGHTVAVLAAYPHLGCVGNGYEVRTDWGIADDVFCAGNEEVFDLLEGVFDEVLDLFPGQYIHIGGDECPKVRWEACPKCRTRMQEEELQDTEELQSWFITRIGRYLHDKGRRMIGWDEILEGGIPPSAAVMSWRGTEGGIAAASQGHEVVMCPVTHCYLDYYQTEDRENEPPAFHWPLPEEMRKEGGPTFWGLTPLSKSYTFDPLDGVPEAHHSLVLGGQSNLWTEYIPTAEQAEYQQYPRGAAIAETVWSPMPSDGRDYDRFIERLSQHLKRLDQLGVNYRFPKEELG